MLFGCRPILPRVVHIFDFLYYLFHKVLNVTYLIKSSVLHRLPIIPFRLLWPLLTSHGSLLLLDCIFPRLARETSSDKSINFPSYVCFI